MFSYFYYSIRRFFEHYFSSTFDPNKGYKTNSPHMKGIKSIKNPNINAVLELIHIYQSLTRKNIKMSACRVLIPI